MAFIVSTLLMSSSIQESCHSVGVAFCAGRYENAATRVPLSRSASARLRAREKRIAAAIAEVLKDFRERKGLSIEELADRSGIAAKRITQFENAERAPLFDELFMLAEGLRLRASTIARRIQNLTGKIMERPAASREARA